MQLLRDSQLTPKIAVENIARIAEIFPSLTEAFYKHFIESLKENKVTDEELTDAVRYIRDSYEYPSPPRVANFINYIKANRPLASERYEEYHINEEARRIEEEKQEEWNRRMRAGEIDPDIEEPKPPKGF